MSVDVSAGELYKDMAGDYEREVGDERLDEVGTCEGEWLSNRTLVYQQHHDSYILTKCQH